MDEDSTPPPTEAPTGALGRHLLRHDVIRSAWTRARNGLVWVDGNSVRLLRCGAGLFPALKRAWAQAKHEIWLETYIFHDDATGMDMVDALIDAATRGVRVRVLIDGFGSHRSVDALTRHFEGTGVDFMVYRPWRRWSDALQRGNWRRLHRKLCVVDRDVAFVGGINLIDDCFDIHHGWSAQPRLDYAVQVDGPVAQQVRWRMRQLWLRTVATGAVQRRLSRAPGPSVLDSADARRRYLTELMAAGSQIAVGPERKAPEPDTQTGMRAALVVRDNLLQRRAIERVYIQAIDAARRSVLLVCPYFYPGRAFRDSLLRAASRGVAVTLLLAGRADYRSAAWAARTLYSELVASGVAVFEYQRAFLHGKVAVVDETWATVGSSNIDPLSLLVNREANLVVADPRFASELAASIQKDIADAQRVDTRHIRTPWWMRPVVALGARLIVAMAGGTRRY